MAEVASRCLKMSVDGDWRYLWEREMASNLANLTLKISTSCGSGVAIGGWLGGDGAECARAQVTRVCECPEKGEDRTTAENK